MARARDLTIQGASACTTRRGNNHLYIFVYGSGIKLSNWTYEEYYTIEGDKLYLWSSKEKMLAGKHDQAIAYERITTP